MTALQLAQHRARMLTLAKVRAEVDANYCVKFREPVLCSRDLRGWRLIPKTLVS